MPISSRFFSFTLFFLNLQLIILPTTLYAHASNDCVYTSIISFGDSLADTGNVKNLVSIRHSQPPHFLFPPYGETFFHYPTGRCSNGRLIIDFIAEGFGLPLIPPYFGNKQNGNKTKLGQGVNYATAGATALDSSFHATRGVPNPTTNVSLRVQLELFKQSLPSFCATSSHCKHLIQHSLILMGEIGGDDYNDELIAGKPFNQIQSFVPLVIDSIIAAVKEVIKLGGKTLVVPGNLPIGCLPVYLTMYNNSDPKMYDNTTGCLIWLNKFSEYHNQLLQRELQKIQHGNPSVNVIYADYYNAAMQFYRSPKDFGFVNGALTACCGGGGPYNYNQSALCGEASSTNCDNPNTYANWDGIHLTEAAYRLIYKSLFQGSYTIPQFSSLCPNITS